MGIIQITPMNQVVNFLENEIARKKQAAFNILNRVGMECLAEARINGNYIDQTGNLRSSIGYAVISDGRVIQRSNFQAVLKGAEGSTKGQNYLDEIISKNSKGMFLIVVAGMEYAAYVATKRNVLDSAQLHAERVMNLYLISLI